MKKVILFVKTKNPDFLFVISSSLEAAQKEIRESSEAVDPERDDPLEDLVQAAFEVEEDKTYEFDMDGDIKISDAVSFEEVPAIYRA